MRQWSLRHPRARVRRIGARTRLTAGISLITAILVGITPFTDVSASSAIQQQQFRAELEAPAADEVSRHAGDEALVDEGGSADAGDRQEPVDEGTEEAPTETDSTSDEPETESDSDPENKPEHSIIGENQPEESKLERSQESLSLTEDDSGPSAGILSVPNFNANANVFYTLDRSEVTQSILGFVTSRTPQFSIRRLTFDAAASTPVAQQNIIMGGTRQLTALTTNSSGLSQAPAVRGSNSLGVTPDGVFYFTTQQGTAAQVGAVDVWRYEMMSMPGQQYNPSGVSCAAGGSPTGSTTTGYACAPQRVYSNMSLNSPTGGTIVGGAYNQRDGFFYYMYFSGTPNTDPSETNPYGRNNVRAHLYRYEPASGKAGEVAHFDVPKHTNFTSSYNGDIAFDAVGNLLMTVSNTGTGTGTDNPGRVMLATFEYTQFASLPTVTYVDQYLSVPTLIPASTVGAYGQTERRNADSGNGINGLAYTSNGYLAMQQGVGTGTGGRISITDPATYEGIGNVRSNTNATGSFVDLATSTSPPVLTVQKNVEGERYATGDQFTLSGNQQLTSTNVEFDSVTTTGDQPGIQTGQIGPLPLQAGGSITVSESISANAANYSSTYECFVENSDGSKGSVFASGEGRSVTFNYLNDVPGAQTGPQQMKCIFTNGPLRPNLTTAKSANPVSTTAVQAADTIQYKLTFDNSTGQAEAAVNHIDYLADVLDDATFVSGSVRYGDGTETGYPSAESPLNPGVTASAPNANAQISIAGAVPTSSVRTVWFEVEVNSNNDVRPDPNTGTDFILNNYLRPFDELPPTECLVDDLNCTTHPVQAWTISKRSLPADGALIHSGGNVNYAVTVSKVNQGIGSWDLDDVTVTDDLTDVLKSAGWTPGVTVPTGARSLGIYLFETASGGSPVQSIVIDGTEPTLVPGSGAAPYYDSSWVLTVPEFDMPANIVRAEIWYTVTAGVPPVQPGEWEPEFIQSGATLTNSATANSTNIPPLQCVTGDESTFDSEECQVTHRIEEGFFAIRKDGVGAGGELVERDLTGHAFEIRDDIDGEMSSSVSNLMCTTQNWEDVGYTGTVPTVPWNVDPASYPGAPVNCAYLYPIESGDQAGRWRSQFLPAGDYWLLETRAPAGHQLLAEPINFSVGDVEQQGKLTIYDSAGDPIPACSGQTDVQGTTACVNPTGWLMVVQDIRMLALPLAGGINLPAAMTGIALLLLAGITTTGIVLRRKNAGKPRGRYAG